MEIVYVNEAKDRSVYRFKKDYERIFERAVNLLNRPGDWVLSVVFVTPERIHAINREYRSVDRVTDVISFAMQDNRENIFDNEEYELGDIFINVDAIRAQAIAYAHSIRREACFLFCHGLLHLMGYDHKTPEDEQTMFELQDVILDEVVRR